MSGDGVIEAEVEAICCGIDPPNGNGSRFNAVKHGLVGQDCWSCRGKTVRSFRLLLMPTK